MKGHARENVAMNSRRYR